MFGADVMLVSCGYEEQGTTLPQHQVSISFAGTVQLDWTWHFDAGQYYKWKEALLQKPRFHSIHWYSFLNGMDI